MGKLKPWPRVSIWQEDHDRDIHMFGVSRYNISIAKLGNNKRVVCVNVQRAGGSPPYQHGIEVHGTATRSWYGQKKIRPIPSRQVERVKAELTRRLEPSHDFIDFVY